MVNCLLALFSHVILSHPVPTVVFHSRYYLNVLFGNVMYVEERIPLSIINSGIKEVIHEE